MKQAHILQQLDAHHPFDQREADLLQRIKDFVRAYENCHSRTLEIGHLTGSAWIIDHERAAALLTHHGKLNLWVQLGGHVENDPDLLSASWREAREESGLTDVLPLTPHIFDVDVHEIPANAKDPAHFHYDIRFLFTADRHAPLTVSSESKSLAWVPLENIHQLTQEESVLRMVRKTSNLR